MIHLTQYTDYKISVNSKHDDFVPISSTSSYPSVQRTIRRTTEWQRVHKTPKSHNFQAGGSFQIEFRANVKPWSCESEREVKIEKEQLKKKSNEE